MQKVINALRKKGIEVSDTPELREQVIAFTNGQDPDTLTAPQAVQVADAISSAWERTSGLTVATSTAPAVNPSGKAAKRDTRQDRTPDIVEALKVAMGVSSQEASLGIVEPIKQFADQYATDAANEAMDAIAEIPNATLTKLGQMAMQHQGNPTFFRGRIEGALSGVAAALSGDGRDYGAL